MTASSKRLRALFIATVLLGTAWSTGLAQAAEPDPTFRLPADASRWTARQQGAVDADYSLSIPSASRLLSANVLGDYYLTSSGLGDEFRGGLRATGGLLSSSPAYRLKLGDGGRAQAGDRFDLGSSISYLGIGYTGVSVRSGWGFSADLGLVSGNLNNLRLGPPPANNLDDVLRDVRLMPVLKMGLFYQY
ncbi:MAG: hypothetical protein JOY60_09255 [Burkholderiaceae bacterium]|nr:hypothetical protein [Burkholderiaceae bacterium]